MIQNYKDGEIVQCTSEQKARFAFCSEVHCTLAPKIWELIPSDIRSANSLGILKQKIKFWTTDKCPCKLCKTYIGNVGFI